MPSTWKVLGLLEALKTGKAADTDSVIFTSSLAAAWALRRFFDQFLGAFPGDRTGVFRLRNGDVFLPALMRSATPFRMRTVSSSSNTLLGLGVAFWQQSIQRLRQGRVGVVLIRGFERNECSIVPTYGSNRPMAAVTTFLSSIAGSLKCPRPPRLWFWFSLNSEANSSFRHRDRRFVQRPVATDEPRWFSRVLPKMRSPEAYHFLGCCPRSLKPCRSLEHGKSG